MRVLILLTVLVVASDVIAESKLKPFNSDGCSSFPDGSVEEKDLWLHCCTDHDLAYWQGGTYKERLAADKQLEVCVADIGKPDIAKLMLAGVRVGGTPYLPTRFRWGYGWPYPRGYKRLDAQERALIEEQLKGGDE